MWQPQGRIYLSSTGGSLNRQNQNPEEDASLYSWRSTGSPEEEASWFICSPLWRISAGTYWYPLGSRIFFIDAWSDVIISSFSNVSACCKYKITAGALVQKQQEQYSIPYQNKQYLSIFRPPSTLIRKITRCNRRRLLRNLLPRTLRPLCELSGKKYMGCGTVIICLLVSVHGNRNFNPALNRSCAIHSYVIWSLNCITAWFIIISVHFKGGCSWFRTHIRMEEGIMS